MLGVGFILVNKAVVVPVFMYLTCGNVGGRHYRSKQKCAELQIVMGL